MYSHILFVHLETGKCFSEALRLSFVKLIEAAIGENVTTLGDGPARVDVNRMGNFVANNDAQKGQLQIPGRAKESVYYRCTRYAVSYFGMFSYTNGLRIIPTGITVNETCYIAIAMRLKFSTY